MARGTEILVTSDPKGVRTTGILSGTPKPGTCMEIVPATAVSDNGHFTYRAYTSGTDGTRQTVYVLDRNKSYGALATTAFTTGAIIQMYTPLAGEHLNVLKGDVSGTADDFAVGDLLIIDTGTGKVILTTGSPESEPFQCLEAVTDPTADQLVWVCATGY